MMYKLAVLPLILLPLFLFGQTEDYSITGKSIVDLRTVTAQPTLDFTLPPTNSEQFTFDTAPQANATISPQKHYLEKLAFFCKVELKLEKATSFPVKFRLGEVQYVDRLEGKY